MIDIDDPDFKKVIELAEIFQKKMLHTPSKNEQSQLLYSLLSNEKNKSMLIHIFDQCFRSKNEHEILQKLVLIFKNHPSFFYFFNQKNRFLIFLFFIFGKYFPSFFITLLKNQIWKGMYDFILPTENNILKKHLKKRHHSGFLSNILEVGEFAIGELEAKKNLQSYLSNIQQPDITHISIKVSNLYSQFHALNYEYSLQILKDRISQLFECAIENPYISKSGEKCSKYIHLDMQEYKYFELILQVFQTTLEQKQFKSFYAGITLQAYLPESYTTLQHLIAWAKKRVDNGGSPIKIRLVKGAHLSCEKIDASLNNWELPTYDTKIEVDANYRKIVFEGLKKEHYSVAHISIASHNLFDLAYAWVLAKKNDLEQTLEIELLEGLAYPLCTILMKHVHQIILYTPILKQLLKQPNFIDASPYLIRRFEEITGKENFLKQSFKVEITSKKWEELTQDFYKSFEQIKQLDHSKQQTQNRLTEIYHTEQKIDVFYNEPNTNWLLQDNFEWAKQIRNEYKKKPTHIPQHFSLQIGQETILEKRETVTYKDSSQSETVVLYSCSLANQEDFKKAILIAKQDPTNWRDTSFENRSKILMKLSSCLRKKRSNFIGLITSIIGKTFIEADIEVSEAIDLSLFYPYSLQKLKKEYNLQFSGKGVGLVISPWNSPLSDAVGGVVSSLITGNTVLLKPSIKTIPIAIEFIKCCWEIGIPKEALQLIPCKDDVIEEVNLHQNINFIIFKGNTSTALKIRSKHPEQIIVAKTGGKNATILTKMADKKKAIQNILISAFSHNGQKCSSTSLLILEKEVYEDTAFKAQLKDAAKSLPVGSIWDFSNKIGPLIHPPEGKLKRAMEELDPGESWLIPPKNIKDNEHVWRPCIKWGVQASSFCHKTELSGPILSVMCAEDLKEAIQIVNSTGYGLTSALESLDKEEQEYWQQNILAGNLYINRPTTNAIIKKQPFGGIGRSSIGLGLKTGGENYVTQFINIKSCLYPITQRSDWSQEAIEFVDILIKPLFGYIKKNETCEFEAVIRAIESYLVQMFECFSKDKITCKQYGESNIIRYLPAGKILIRIEKEDNLFDTLTRIAAVRISKCPFQLSINKNFKNEVTVFLNNNPTFINALMVYQNDEEVIETLSPFDRIRYAHPNRVNKKIANICSELGIYIDSTPPHSEGRFELLHYLQEQSISNRYHRYGNILN